MLIGANNEYIERKIQQVFNLMVDDIDEVLEHSEVILIGNPAKEFKKIEPKLTKEQTVVKLVRIFGKRTSDANYQGIFW